MPRTARLALVAASAALVAVAAASAPASAAAACDQVASPGPGAAQALVDSLSAGQTGCLREGTYQGNVKVTTPGITLTRFGTEKPLVRGRLYIAEGADGVSVERLHLDGTNSGTLPSPTINANRVSFRSNDVTNNHHSICFSLGHRDWGRAVGTRIEFNRIHDCGRLPATNHDHGIYVTAASNTLIRGNWIYDNADRGIQLYPDAQNTMVTGNVIDGNGQGIIFSGEGGLASSGNTVEGNVIANSKLRNNVESWYPPGNPTGRNNVVRNNCVKGGAYDDGDGGIGDQIGFKVVGAVRTRPSYNSRSGRDFRLVAGSACHDVLATYRGTTPGPEGLSHARPIRGLRRRAPVTLAAARRHVRRGRRLALAGQVAPARLSPGLRVTIIARSRGHRRRLGTAAVRADGSYALRPRVRAGQRARHMRLRAVVRGVGQSRSIRLTFRPR